MSTHFTPKTGILPPPQQRVWRELAGIPSDYVLWGGTALALHLGHRQSVDFDFFSNVLPDFDALLIRPLFQNCRVTQRTPGSMSCVIDRDGPVKMSFFSVPNVLRPLSPPHVVHENGLKVASLLDVAAMKAKVVCDRAEQKDYIDIDAVLRLSSYSLAEVLSAAKAVYGATYEPMNSLKALTYFGDGDLPKLPQETKARLVVAAAKVDVQNLPDVKRGVGGQS